MLIMKILQRNHIPLIQRFPSHPSQGVVFAVAVGEKGEEWLSKHRVFILLAALWMPNPQMNNPQIFLNTQTMQTFPSETMK